MTFTFKMEDGMWFNKLINLSPTIPYNKLSARAVTPNPSTPVSERKLEDYIKTGGSFGSRIGRHKERSHNASLKKILH